MSDKEPHVNIRVLRPDGSLQVKADFWGCPENPITCMRAGWTFEVDWE